MKSFGAGDDALSQSHPKSTTVGFQIVEKFGWCFKISTICVKTGPGLVICSLEVDQNVGESTMGGRSRGTLFFCHK